MRASACCAATSPTPRRRGCAASSSTAACECWTRLLSMGRPHTRTAITCPSPTRRRRSRTRADRRSRTSRAPCCLEFRNGRCRSAASTRKRTSLLGRSGEFFGALDGSYRSSFSSSPSASRYLVVEGYSLLNARVGFRWTDGWTLSLWCRNLLDKNYYELLTAAPGNTGLYVGQPGDRRTIGLTMRVTLRSGRS